MFSRAWGVAGILFFFACSTPEKPKPLTISEQIEVDTQKAQSLSTDFEKKVRFVSFPEGTPFLNSVARKVSNIRYGFQSSAVTIRIHYDDQKNLSRFFSFPGTMISIPLSFLMRVDFENELAAAFAYELSNVMSRYLAKKLDDPEIKEVQLFGPESVFNLNRTERAASIDLGTKLLYYAGYDLRGMSSIFRQYPTYFGIDTHKPKISEGKEALGTKNDGLVFMKKEVEFNLRESQRAKSAFLPSMNPLVKSAEFIKMKKALKELKKTLKKAK